MINCTDAVDRKLQSLIKKYLFTDATLYLESFKVVDDACYHTIFECKIDNLAAESSIELRYYIASTLYDDIYVGDKRVVICNNQGKYFYNNQLFLKD